MPETNYDEKRRQPATDLEELGKKIDENIIKIEEKINESIDRRVNGAPLQEEDINKNKIREIEENLSKIMNEPSNEPPKVNLIDQILKNNEQKIILDSEKNDIEEKILKEVEKKPEEPPQDKEKELKRKTKAELIKEFLKIQETQGKKTHEESQLKKMLKNDIIKLIANYANEIIEKPKGAENASQQVADVLRTAEGLNMIAESLFNMNLLITSGSESLSVYFKKRTKDIALLEGFTQNVIDRKQEFIIIFKAMYLNHKTEFDKYLSPVAQYAMMMALAATVTVTKNIKKKETN